MPETGLALAHPGTFLVSGDLQILDSPKKNFKNGLCRSENKASFIQLEKKRIHDAGTTVKEPKSMQMSELRATNLVS